MTDFDVIREMIKDHVNESWHSDVDLLCNLASFSNLATRFEIAEDVFVEKRGKNSWCVSVFGGTVLDRDLNRHYEPMPSNRTEEFIAATRFSLPEAMAIADRYVAQ